MMINHGGENYDEQSFFGFLLYVYGLSFPEAFLWYAPTLFVSRASFTSKSFS